MDNSSERAEDFLHGLGVADKRHGIGVGRTACGQQGHDSEPQGPQKEVMLHATKLQMRRIFAAAAGGSLNALKQGPVVQGIE